MSWPVVFAAGTGRIGLMDRLIITTLFEIQSTLTAAATRDGVTDRATSMVAGNPLIGHEQTM